MLKKDIFEYKKTNVLGDFQIEYILTNKNSEPKTINKIVKISEWYGENRKEVWNLDFIPEKLLIVSYLGETTLTYNCYVKYRQSIPPVMCFIPKKAVINNFLFDDYHNMIIDFDRYDKLSTSIDSRRTLREHQKEAVKFLLSRKKCILADDMGFGKTCELSVAAIEGNFDSVLIICPASLKTNWKNELSYFIPEKDITIIDGFNDKSKTDLELFLGYSQGKSNKTKSELLDEAKISGKWQFNRFVIVNYDILDEFFTFSRAKSEEGQRKALEESPILKYIYNRKSCIIVDEAHKLSNNTSTRYKIIKQLIKKGNPECVFLATGTPITNYPLNLFYILNLIENEVTGDMKYYKERYCGGKEIFLKGEYAKWKNIWYKMKSFYPERNLTNDEWKEMKEYINKKARKITIANDATNLDELKEKISHIYLRREKGDLRSLPRKYVHELYYDLSYSQQLEYNKLWDEYVKIQGESGVEKELNKELLEGGIYRKYLSNLMVNNTIKLCDKLLEKEDKVVIMCCYDEELYTIKDYYGDSAVIYNGKCSLKQKDNMINEFNTNPNVKVFIGNIIAAGVGISLTISKSLIFNTFSYVSGENKQAEDRIHRLNSTRDVDIYYQIFNNTQYQHMWDIVLKKQLICDTVIKKESEK
jgi:SWI/SNF-related matrix-associated actin-dependent regulator 1 of chromatin subfamily A